MPDLTQFNNTDATALRAALMRLTASPAWADALVAGRPYADVDSLFAASDDSVTSLVESEIDAALSGHPRIGESAAGLDAESKARSAREQSGMAEADHSLQDAMARGNADYEQRFGRIYLVAAAGRSAEELVRLLRERLGNDPEAELDVVRRELARITRLRLADMDAVTGNPLVPASTDPARPPQEGTP
ncbi:2-oxo-4-hydroxy-4-carboxy-5-ureidoimidazoline decarboxylase [Knoellia sp. S7-12]|uniref:2-oxo-4-hydroxy-4-carboxy-5-ureidoimidazoline decarboxylase n=1 Tax=Knoellia sp. S7-12 TaxID=3126698 RepID=UPI0033665768